MYRLVAIFVVLVSISVSGCTTHTVGELNRMGLDEYRKVRYSEAKAYFEQAWKMDRERPVTLYNLGRCAMAMGQQRFRQGRFAASLRYLDEAIHWFDSAIESFPGYTDAQIAHVQALDLQGKYRKALQAAEWADTYVGPGAKQKLVLAGHYERIGDLDEALLCYRQAAAIESDNSYVRAELGRFYARQGLTSQARAEFQRAQELRPTDPDVAGDLARLGPEPDGDQAE
ncbi:MAG TPA: tetratricopeptide repeat protein [Phycisphaerae bacterium]|nr:tetratricopeptide repeat protein [Phycisphaerae bacterium]